MSRYLDQLHAQGLINDDEYRALIPTGVQSPEEMYAVTLHFPSLADALPGGNLAKISSLAAQRASLGFRNIAMARLGAPVSFAKGARHPANAPFPLGSSASPPQTVSAATVATLPARIDHHTAWRSAGWHVRDQGQRGTCVAHALVGCKEHLAFQSTQLPTSFDGSEQFLFWGAKQFDPSNADGTLHGYALKALQNHGLCDEAMWPYVAQPTVGGTVHQGPPPASAVAAGSAALHAGGTVATSANASQLHLQLLMSPVAIGVPVFADPLQPNNDNWNVGGLMDYGRVVDPQPRSVVIGGHAVCVVGFEPDPQEPAGQGWFIIRNSWGTGIWGRQLPANGYWAPEPGYGQMSWSYVDSYLWEMCWLV